MVFVGGIHGVGKTTYCRALAPRICLSHLTAGDLIQTGGSFRAEKGVADIDLNQARLIAALDARKAAGEAILLDGHFCLLSTTFEVVPIPVEVFRLIAPTRMLLMEASAQEVEARLHQRDSKRLELNLIQAFAAAERAHASAISSALRVPMKIIGNTTPIKEVRQFLV